MAPVCKRRKIPVSGEMVLLKAQEYARVCDCKNIEKLDMNWINRSKVREKLCAKIRMVKQNLMTNLVWLSGKITVSLLF